MKENCVKKVVDFLLKHQSPRLEEEKISLFVEKVLKNVGIKEILLLNNKDSVFILTEKQIIELFFCKDYLSSRMYNLHRIVDIEHFLDFNRTDKYTNTCISFEQNNRLNLSYEEGDQNVDKFLGLIERNHIYN